jgi:hypothetical protein
MSIEASGTAWKTSWMCGAMFSRSFSVGVITIDFASEHMKPLC